MYVCIYVCLYVYVQDLKCMYVCMYVCMCIYVCRGKQEERMGEAIETMQRIYKGVYGKLADLCRPIQKKYALAVTVAAG